MTAKPLSAAVLLALRDGEWTSQSDLGRRLRNRAAVYRAPTETRHRKVAEAINAARDDGGLEFRLRAGGPRAVNEYRLSQAGHAALEAYLDEDAPRT